MSPLMRGYMLGIIFPPMAGRCLGRANIKTPLGLKFSFPGVFTFARYPLMNPALTRSTVCLRSRVFCHAYRECACDAFEDFFWTHYIILSTIAITAAPSAFSFSSASFREVPFTPK